MSAPPREVPPAAPRVVLAPEARAPYRWQPEPPPRLADLRAGGDRARRWRRYWLTDLADGLGDVAFASLFRFGPVETCSNLGAWFGRKLITTYPDATERARQTLRHLKPGFPEDQEQAWLTSMWANIGRTFAEAAVLDRLHASGRVNVSGMEHFHQALADGVPAIALFAHLGNWELNYGVLARGGVPLSFTYQPPDNRIRHWLIRRIRRRQGVELLPPGLTSMRPVVKRMRAGKVAGFAVDESLDDYCYGPGFGRPVNPGSNMVLVQRLAHMTGARVIAVCTIRHDTGLRFDTRIGPVVLDYSREKPKHLTDEHIADGVAAMNAHFEPLIHAHLQQWFMLHLFGIPDGEHPRFDPAP